MTKGPLIQVDCYSSHEPYVKKTYIDVTVVTHVEDREVGHGYKGRPTCAVFYANGSPCHGMWDVYGTADEITKRINEARTK